MREDNLVENIESTINNFKKELKNIYKEGLTSVILYGSASSLELAQHSNINILVILQDTTLENLVKASGLINSRKYRLLKPLFLTEDYIARSLDVFPLEFLDMQENYRVIYGKDILSYLKVDIKNLKFQCEQELKSKLINLKDAYLRADNKALLKEILFKSATSIIHILRGIIRAQGKKAPYKKEDVLGEASWQLDTDVTNLTKILEARRNNSKLTAKEVDALFMGLARELEKIIILVDSL